ncbi:MAG: hypothetical protein ACI4NV_01300, partial [Thermoguttaceae bacterium]
MSPSLKEESTSRQRDPFAPKPKAPPILSRPSSALARVVVRAPATTLAVVAFLAGVALFFSFCYLENAPAPLRYPSREGTTLFALDELFRREVADRAECQLVVEGNAKKVSPKQIQNALDLAWNELNARPELFEIVYRSLDSESFKENRAFFYDAREMKKAEELAATALRIQRGAWDEFAPDAFALKLARQSELPATPEASDSLDASEASDSPAPENLDALLTFARAVVDATSPETRSPAQMRSPVAPGVEASVPKLLQEERYATYSRDGAEGGYVAFAMRQGLSTRDQRYALDEVARIAERLKENNPEIDVEATGLPFFAARERDAFLRAGKKATPLAFAGVFVVFWAFFGRAIYATLAAGAILLCAAVILGLQTFAVGSFSPDDAPQWALLVCAAILFVASYLGKYTATRREIRSASEALVRMGSNVGVAILSWGTSLLLLGALGAFVEPSKRAFFVVLGGGAFLSALIVATALPAALRLIDGANPFKSSPGSRSATITLESAGSFLRVISILATVGMIGLAYGVSKIETDPTHYAFYASTSQVFGGSDATTRRVESAPLNACVFAEDAEDARKLREKFSEVETLVVDDVASRIPDVGPDQIVAVERLSDALAGLEPEIGAIPIPDRKAFLASLDAISERVKETSASTKEGKGTLDLLDVARKQIGALSDAELETRLDAFARLVAVGTLERLYLLKGQTTPRAPTIDDLSPTLKRRYVAEDSGRLIVWAYSLARLSSPGALRAFVANIRAVDTEATGPAVLAEEAWTESTKMGNVCVGALFAIFGIWGWARYRAAKQTLAILLAPAFMLVGTAGIAGLFHMGVNPVNWLIFPTALALGFVAGEGLARELERDPTARLFSREYVLGTACAGLSISCVFLCWLVAPEKGWQELA